MENPETAFKETTSELYDKYIKKSEKMEKIYDRLDAQIDKIYNENVSDQQFYQQISRVFGALQIALSSILPPHYLLKYGSTVNGLSNKQGSDLDLTIIFEDFDLNHKDLLTTIKKHLKSLGYILPTDQGPMPRQDSSGWLLKFKDPKENIEVDITINRMSEVYNSNLLLQYSMADKRFEKVVHFLKAWNKGFSKNLRLNNFSIYLMLIALMQYDKILPNLQSGKTKKLIKQQMLKKKSGMMVDEQNIYYIKSKGLEIQKPQKRASEILIRFFKFYSLEFSPSYNAIDIAQLMCESENLYEGKSIVDKQQLLMHIQQKQKDPSIEQFVNSHFLPEIYNLKYVILDPFNHTYCPAKNVKLKQEESLYPKAFEDALRSILINGQI